jgi:metal-responsive CopG/Arc/MetJ family transcriptional regulator
MKKTDVNDLKPKRTKVNINYSLDNALVDEFNREVPVRLRSKVVEQLIREFVSGQKNGE